MKVKQIVFSEKALEEWDFRGFLQIEIDGFQKFRFLDGELEDATLARDYNDVYKIISVMKEAYQAGKDGKDFEVEEIEVDDL